MYQAKILHKQGMKKSVIAKILDVNRRTIYNYLNDRVFDPHSPGRGRPTGSRKLAPFADFIEQKLDDDLFVCSEFIYQAILGLGYTGKTTILGDYLKKRRDELMAYAVYRFETSPGYQAQVDWAECGYVWKNGLLKKRHCFVMKMGYSRRSYMEFTTSMKQSVLFACMKRAFEYFGGVPHEILFDNMKTAFLFDSTVGKWNPHPRMAAFAAHYNFAPRRCRVRRPETKGKVEREIRYLRSSFFAGLRFDGIDVTQVQTDELNERVLSWLRRVDAKVLREHGQSRLERFVADHEALEPIAVQPFNHRVDEVVCVSREAKILFETNTYSIDASFRGKTLRAKFDPDGRTLTVYSEGKQVKHINLLPKGGKGEMIDALDRESLMDAWYEDRERCQRHRHRKSRKSQNRAQRENVITSPSVYDAVFGTYHQAQQEVAA